MKELELTPRLRAIVGLVPSGARLADIGTDHAYLPAALLLSGKIRYALASDINEGPLQRGMETARTYGLDDHRLCFRCCSGLQGIRPEDRIDTAVMAGMGGELIARILQESPWSRSLRLILQPMSTQPELRRWLNENRYTIRRETLVREGDKLYVILTAESGEDAPYSRAELWAGRQKRTVPQSLREAYLNDLIRRRRRALRGMEAGTSMPASRLDEERDLIAQLESMREEWIAWQR